MQINESRILIINQYLYDREAKIRRLDEAIRNLADGGFSFDTIRFEDLSQSKIDSAEGLILSGRDSRGRDRNTKKNLVGLYSNEKKLLSDFSGPVLGVCFGSQILSQSYGERLVATGKHKGWSKVQLLKKPVDPILEGLPDEFQVFEAHSMAIRFPPLHFTVLAQTLEGEPQIIRHLTKPHYGAQFHPEAISENEQAGSTFLTNFLNLTQGYLKFEHG